MMMREERKSEEAEGEKRSSYTQDLRVLRSRL